MQCVLSIIQFSEAALLSVYVLYHLVIQLLLTKQRKLSTFSSLMNDYPRTIAKTVATTKNSYNIISKLYVLFSLKLKFHKQYTVRKLIKVQQIGPSENKIIVSSTLSKQLSQAWSVVALYKKSCCGVDICSESRVWTV